MTGLSLQSPVRLAPSRRVKQSLNTLKPGADFFSLVMYVRSSIFFHSITLFLVSSKVTLRLCLFLWSIHVTNIFSILTMMLDWPDDTFIEPLPAPAFTAAIIFSLSFLMVHNSDSGRLSAFLMAAVDSPLSYLLISIFCSVIDFLAFFLLGASLALRSCFGTMIH